MSSLDSCFLGCRVVEGSLSRLRRQGSVIANLLGRIGAADFRSKL